MVRVQHLTQAGIILEEGTSTEKMLPSDWPVTNLKGVFLIHYLCGGAQPTVGNTTSGQGGWSCIKK